MFGCATVAGALAECSVEGDCGVGRPHRQHGHGAQVVEGGLVFFSCCSRRLWLEFTELTTIYDMTQMQGCKAGPGPRR